LKTRRHSPRVLLSLIGLHNLQPRRYPRLLASLRRLDPRKINRRFYNRHNSRLHIQKIPNGLAFFGGPPLLLSRRGLLPIKLGLFGLLGHDRPPSTQRSFGLRSTSSR